MIAGISPVARSVPFDNTTNGFVSSDVQSAIEEAKRAASATSFDRILTHKFNSAGSLRQTYDPSSGRHINDGPGVVVDNAGNVVFY